MHNLFFFLLTFLSPNPTPEAPAPKAIEKIRVFDSVEHGYASTRDPALCLTAKGTLLAFCEARFDGPGDWASIDLLARRSTDGGRTWSAPRVVIPREKGKPIGNIVPIVERDGRLHLIYHLNYERAFVLHSTDDGLTWSQPRDITAAFDAFRPEYDWKVIASGPGHGVQLRNGRLLVGVWLCQPNPDIPGGQHRPSVVATVFSDDHGQTWQRGDIVARHNDVVVNPSENHPVELEDGRVLLDVRNESGPHRRLFAYSPDGATRWTKPAFHPQLYEPTCNASIHRLSWKKESGKSRLLFCNPDSETDTAYVARNHFRKRINLAMRLSYDEGKTWPIKKTIEPGRTGYCDIATGPDGTVYVLYEAGEGHNSGTVPASLYLARFGLDWLTDGRDSWKN